MGTSKITVFADKFDSFTLNTLSRFGKRELVEISFLLAKQACLCHKKRVNTARVTAIFLLSLWGIFFPQVAMSAPAPAESGAAFLLHSLSVVTQGSAARLEASVAVTGLTSLQASLREGASFHLDADVQVDLLRSLLPNRTVSTSHVTCLIRFDPMTREFLLMLPNSLPIRHKRLDTLFQAAVGDSVHIFPLPQDHTDGDQYRASLTLSLRYADVPPWLRKTLFFWSWNIIEPMTFTLDFVPNAPKLPEPMA